MDKRVIFAVAGSGKTTHLISQLNLEQRFMLLTYTISNYENLRDGIIRKFGYFPDNIKLRSYFNFLYSFCYRPFLLQEVKAKGINWKLNTNRFAIADARFVDQYNRLYSNRIAKLLEEKKVIEYIQQRLSKYFDYLFIDEVQDFAGHDFNLIKNLSSSTLNILLVGDFYQHTFDTSRDGAVNRTLHDNYEKYQESFKNLSFLVDITTLKKSWRCSPSICQFISDSIGIGIESHRNDKTAISFITDEAVADDIFNDISIVKLFYQEHYKYGCYSKNWGDCKGEDKYESVCVVLNQNSLKMYMADELRQLPAQTLNKLYVACSRAKGNLYFVSDKLFKKYKTS